ncbi:MAG TPA: CDP-archaeol synthase [Candidatus Saccharimonadales bacterium]|nr:CDP-archaeol synthase [Candidatus Saccharimonadales bacterium]
MDNLIFALWFFLPAGIANVTPVIVAKVPVLSELNAPVDFGFKFRGRELLGTHKTIRGLVLGTLVGTLVFFDQTEIGARAGGLDYTQLSIWLGALMSFGALFGDIVKSFFKRQLNVASGKSWFPFDQLDYIVGGLAFSAIIIRLEFGQYLSIFIVWFALHLISSYVGYLVKLKKDPI